MIFAFLVLRTIPSFNRKVLTLTVFAIQRKKALLVLRVRKQTLQMCVHKGKRCKVPNTLNQPVQRFTFLSEGTCNQKNYFHIKC